MKKTYFLTEEEKETKIRNDRDRLICELVKDAVKISGKNAGAWTRKKERDIWKRCLEWNSKNPEYEIFMYEYSTFSGDDFTGFFIEDDYFITEYPINK